MARVLITGMSGAGKSSVLAALAARGHRTVDTDEDGWSVEADAGAGPETLWREDRIGALLAEPVDGTLFVAGCVANQGRFYDRFEAVVLLTAPVAVLLDRVATRTTNPFGRSAADRERILADVREVEPLLRRTATAVLATDRPLEAVADEVEALSRRPGTAAPAPR